MDQDRWRMVNEIFHAALEVSAGERRDFVYKASGRDLSLADEVNHLLQADLDAGSYIESPVVNGSLLRSAIASLTPALAPGDVLCGRFRIVRAVGEGGMGHVFEALDEELGVHVALKMIRPEIASNPEALARFRQEVRLARRITHPNVCRTFDLERETRIVDAERGATAEFVFLTMEFLEGETLAEKIAREGPLPLDLAADLARQVAGALQAAHALGVIHRDIKPSNIMLVPAPACAHGLRAVVTDFGLARAESIDSLRSLSGISNRANPIGTLAYMAPEQLAGAPLSAATDIYAFGLLLFEMATGKRAFPSNALLSGITQRLAGPPPDPAAHAPALPDPWRRGIAACLQVKPEERVPVIVDAVDLVDGRRDGFRVRGQGLRAALRRQLTWGRAATALLILCAAVSLFWAGLRYSLSRAAAKVAPGALVYLAPVKNQTGEKALDNITELIQAGLAQSTQINLLDQGRVGDTLQRMTKSPDTIIDEPIAREIAMRTGAVRVVFARVSGSSGHYQLDVDVQQPDSDPRRYREHWPKTFTWQSTPSANTTTIPQDLLVAVRNASDWTRKEVGESANDIARLNVPPEDVTTGNWQALADYSDAEGQALKNPDAAVILLQHAVKIDPGFALAYARMADLLFALNRFEEGHQAYSRALDEDLAQRMTRRERDFIKGTFAVDTRDFASAEEAFRDCSIYHESDALCTYFRAYPLRMLGRSREALDALDRALRLAPSFTGAYTNEAYDYILLGDNESAAKAVNHLRESGYEGEAGVLAGELAFLQSDVSAAETAFSGLKGTRVNLDWSIGYALQARLAAEAGLDDQAIQFLDSGIDVARSHQDRASEAARLFDRAYLYSRRGDVPQCLRDVDTAFGLDSSPAAIIRQAAILGYLAMKAPGGSGLIEKRLSALERNISASASGVIFDLARYRVHGEILLATGKPELAVAEFEKADKLDSVITDREYLARALVEAARQQRDPEVAAAFRQRALDAYERIALHPERVWFFAQWSPPGLFAYELQDALSVSEDLASQPDAQRLKQQILSLRQASTRAASNQFRRPKH